MKQQPNQKAGSYLKQLCMDIPERYVGSQGNRRATDLLESYFRFFKQIIDDAALQDGARHQLEIMRLEPLHVLGMEHELHSAFSNLVLNAIRYTPADGKIQVLWYRNEQAEGVFEVHDQGIGIDAKHLPFITQRFYRVDSARSRSKGGTGLGLAIVKHVLQRHDARLDVSSELGKGSAFKCIFPPGRLVEKTSPSERQLAS